MIENLPFDLHSSREIHTLNAPQLINFLARERQFRTFLQGALTTRHTANKTIAWLRILTLQQQ